ncbi:uncharacterized protein [Cicer arietinum]|uniref:uncharacterized protein isoform X2 n=1 Tax=Cicer arietinum TaxID=3827 RepID=UPI00032A9AF7
MTSLPLLLLLIFCVSLHACTPRPLNKKDTANYYYTDKELNNVKLLETFNTLSVKEYNKLKENLTQQQKVANNEINTCVNCNSASTLKEVIGHLPKRIHHPFMQQRMRGDIHGQCWDQLDTMSKKQWLQTPMTMERT